MEGEEPRLPDSLLAKAFGVRSIAWLDVFWDLIECDLVIRRIL